jgi:hypothetical protein
MYRFFLGFNRKESGKNAICTTEFYFNNHRYNIGLLIMIKGLQIEFEAVTGTRNDVMARMIHMEKAKWVYRDEAESVFSFLYKGQKEFGYIKFLEVEEEEQDMNYE